MGHRTVKVSKILLGLPLAFSATAAFAIPVVGTSGGSFSNLSSCDNSGSVQDCRIVNTAANGSNTQVQWGSTNSSNFTNPSRLTAVDVGINTDTATGGLGVVIGRLDWYNSATIAREDLNSFNVRWTLSLNFSTPSGGDRTGSEGFDLRIANPLNPPGDLTYGLGLADLAALAGSINLSGVLMSNLRYQVVDGAGSGTSTFIDNVWYNDEYNYSSLYILADFTSRTSVPEPASLALFGLGLLGIGVATRRRMRGGSAA